MFTVALFLLVFPVVCIAQEPTNQTKAEEEYVVLNSADRYQRPESAECGVYALAAAAKTFKPNTDVLSILDRRYVPDYRGSSSLDLVQAALDHGFVASPWKSVGIQFLKSANYPVLLNVTRNRSSPCSGHWVAWLGEKDGEAIVYDVLLPERVSTISYSELLDGMTGDALLVSPDSLGVFEVWQLRLGCFRSAFPLIPLFIVGVVFFSASAPRIRVRPKWQIGIVLGVSITWGRSRQHRPRWCLSFRGCNSVDHSAPRVQIKFRRHGR